MVILLIKKLLKKKKKKKQTCELEDQLKMEQEVI